MLGTTGFTIITIAALISTFSAINASLYGGSRVSYEIAEDDELPHGLTSNLWNQPLGLFITAVCTLLIVNTLHLESISTAGSVGFLLIFSAVNFTGYRLADKISAKKGIPLLGFVLTLLAALTLILQQFGANRTGILISLGIVVFCFALEFAYKRFEAKKKNR